MKNAFKTAIKAGALAAALTFAQAGHATSIQAASATIYLGDATILGENFATIVPRNVLTDDGLSFLAFCIEPEQFAYTDVNNYKAFSIAPTDAVKRLYQSSYSLVIGNGYDENKAASFQLALWSIITPSTMSLVATGGVFEGNQEMIQDAINMVSVARDWDLSKGPSYTYTAFRSANSQDVMTVDIAAAVPEADTWAMLAAGLGLIGFMGRRRAAQGRKFAA